MFLLRLVVFIVLLISCQSLSWASGSGAFRVETPDAGAFGKGSAFVGEANTPAAEVTNGSPCKEVTLTPMGLEEIPTSSPKLDTPTRELKVETPT